jgi:chromosome segregation ATPase
VCVQNVTLQIQKINTQFQNKSNEFATIQASLQDLKDQIQRHIEEKQSVENDKRNEEKKKEELEEEVNLLKNQITVDQEEVDKLLSKSIAYMEEETPEMDVECELLDDNYSLERMSEVWKDLEGQEKQLNDDKMYYFITCLAYYSINLSLF